MATHVYAITSFCNATSKLLISLGSAELNIFENTLRFRASDSTFFES